MIGPCRGGGGGQGRRRGSSKLGPERLPCSTAVTTKRPLFTAKTNEDKSSPNPGIVMKEWV